MGEIPILVLNSYKRGIQKNCSMFLVAKLMFPDISVSVAVVLAYRVAETQEKV